MLGLGSTVVGRVYNGSTDFRGTGPIWIRLTADEVCKGTESSLELCKAKHLWQHDHHCSHAEDVAITCSSAEDAAAAAADYAADLVASPTHASLNSGDNIETPQEVPAPSLKSVSPIADDRCGEVKVDLAKEEAIPRITGW
jgi:hypothetical protein